MLSRFEAFVHGGALLKDVSNVHRRCGQRRASVSMLIGRTLLNAPRVGQKSTGPTTEDIAGELQSQIKSLYVEYLDIEGMKVDYDALRNSDGFKEYETQALGLVDTDPTRLNRDQRIAFFVNLYNALTIHGMARAKVQPSNLPSRLIFYSKTSYMIGGQPYSLNDIENNVLRGNKQQVLDPLKLMIFTPSDPRFRSIVNPPDPRIHFALNCGAMSCPPIRFYTAENLEFGLQASTESFIASDDNVRILPQSKVVYLSQIFKWYKTDFAPSGEDVDLLSWVQANASSDSDKAKELKTVLDAGESVEIKWLEYDWSVNSV
ncbi:hypothetical protein NDN08_001370 [Rhodosorus marinus]|uniref:DUF547 domain-containing protein n=1 Tax=Rhodosorus marinus TaxID=101924 RepID=A0AAV8UWF3_9RHOD|nr:hypothetical protein NDN08_001370 [Rhodosorus marinus]